jgi:hypothetical protein
VFRRDCWTCRYCGGQTVAPPVLRVLSHMYPDRFPFHPNWKAGRVHPAYLLLSTSLDHVQAGGCGGSWTKSDNPVAACWPCNSGKSATLDEIGWRLLSEADVQSDWDGLTGSYPGRPASPADPKPPAGDEQGRDRRPGRRLLRVERTTHVERPRRC